LVSKSLIFYNVKKAVKTNKSLLIRSNQSLIKKTINKIISPWYSIPLIDRWLLGQIIPPMIFAISAFTVISLSVGVMFDLIRKIVEETKDASFDRCHFTDFGDFSLNFELVYYIPTNNYLAAMEAQQSINLKIIEEFAVNNIEFAFPTQTLNIESNKSK